jgi:glycerol-3-phosphate acyltransferase
MIKGRPSAGPLQLILDKNNNKLAAVAGVLFICSHRTLLDPIFFSVALGCCITAVTYSISQFSEMVSPIKTVALTHNKEQDATNIHKLLAEGDLAICLEGTTCCEKFVLCFSSLFAEFTDQIIPVAMNNRNSIFHGTTGTGYKCMDPFFFFMNPRPVHEISFLTPLPRGLTCAAGKLPNDFANYTHRNLAATLGFHSQNLEQR